MDIILGQLKQEFSLTDKVVTNIVTLIDEGNTIPFIARYRKELTNSADDALLRKFYERLKQLRALEEKRADILRLIGEQDALTDELREKIEKRPHRRSWTIYTDPTAPSAKPAPLWQRKRAWSLFRF